MPIRPLPVIANVYRIALLWTSTSGQHAVNVFHVRKASSNAAAVLTAVVAAVTQDMWASVSNSASITQVAITPLDGSSATLVTAVSGTIWSGEQGGDFIPQGATLVSLRSSLRGARNRGRLFLPFLAESVQSNGALATSTRTLMQAGWNSFLTTLTSSSTDLVVASYKFPGAQIVTGALVEQMIATQRRRMSRLR
jgi:hypothetical protein